MLQATILTVSQAVGTNAAVAPTSLILGAAAVVGTAGAAYGAYSQSKETRRSANEAETVLAAVQKQVIDAKALAEEVIGSDDETDRQFPGPGRWSSASNQSGLEQPNVHREVQAMLLNTTGMAQQQSELYVLHHKNTLRVHSAYQIASLLAGALGFLILIAGAALAYATNVETGVLTSVAGVVTAAAGKLIYDQANEAGRRANDALFALTNSLHRIEALKETIRVATLLSDEHLRNRLYAIVALQVSFPDAPVDHLASVIVVGEKSLEPVED